MDTAQSNVVDTAITMDVALDLDFQKQAGEIALSVGEPDEVFKPSIHIAMTDAMTQFIRAGMPPKYKDNVVVLFPNLDVGLKDVYQRMVNNNTALVYIPKANVDNPNATIPIYFSAFRQLVESLGCQVIRKTKSPASSYSVSSDIDQISGMLYTNPSIGINTVNPWTGTGENDLKEQIKLYDIHVACQTNYSIPFIGKLQAVGKAINTQMAVASDDDYISTNMKLYIETDQEVLAIMKEAGMINNQNIPAIIWAGSMMKESFLDARILETRNALLSHPDPDKREASTKTLLNILSKLHVYDILTKGVDDYYMKKIIDLILPIPHTSPFQTPTGDMSNFLGEDMNVVFKNEEVIEEMENSLKYERMPVFAYGTKNPNILKVKMDLDNIYTSLLHMSSGVVKQNSQATINRVIDPMNEVYSTQLFEDMKKWAKELKKNEEAGKIGVDAVPQKFKDYLDLYFHNPKLSMDQARFTDEWKDHGLKETFARAGTVDESIVLDEFRKVDKFILRMWENFLNLYNNFGKKYQPKSYRVLQANNPTAQNVRNIEEATTKLAEQAIIGKITTLPFFHLSNPRNSIQRPCLLLAREPRFSHIKKGSTIAQGDRATWTTGLYDMYGFTHTITDSIVESEFNVTRSTLRGANIIKVPN